METVQEKKENLQEKVETTHKCPNYTPATDIYEKGNKIVVVADIPGVADKDVNISLEKRVLTITGRTTALDTSGYRLLYSECEPCVYRRTFSVSEDIDTDKIEATVKNGVLTVLLPKAEKLQPRTIQVKVG